MFVLSKIIGFLIDPLTLIIAPFLIAAILRWRGLDGLARFLTRIGVLLTVIILATPLPETLLRGLEDRHPQARDVDLDTVAGAIILGGAQEGGELAQEKDTYLLNSSSERLISILELRERRPDLPIILSGGSGRVFPVGWKEAEVSRAFLNAVGVGETGVTYEDRSTNTFENGVFTKALLPNGTQPWLLVTSAPHMPRAVEIFRAVGIKIIPYPVDFSAPKPKWAIDRIGGRRLHWLNLALRERVGMLYFKKLQAPKLTSTLAAEAD